MSGSNTLKTPYALMPATHDDTVKKTYGNLWWFEGVNFPQPK